MTKEEIFEQENEILSKNKEYMLYERINIFYFLIIIIISIIIQGTLITEFGIIFSIVIGFVPIIQIFLTSNVIVFMLVGNDIKKRVLKGKKLKVLLIILNIIQITYIICFVIFCMSYIK